MLRLAKPLAALVCLLPLAGLPADAPVDERTAAYERYRAAFDARNYLEALPLAVRVVELTANQFDEEAPELANPLTNLATTLYRLEQHSEALDTYRRALTVLDLTGNATDPRLVAPLHGMGLTLRAMERHEEAIVPLKRAVDIVRNREGLHSPAQLPMLKALLDCYEKTWRLDEAAREHQYAFNVAEQAYGSNDPRMIGALADLARWHEQTGRYSLARVLHSRAVQITDSEQPRSIKAVEPLRGIARTGEGWSEGHQPAGHLPKAAHRIHYELPAPRDSRPPRAQTGHPSHPPRYRRPPQTMFMSLRVSF